MDAEPSQLAGCMSLEPKTRVTACNSSAAGAGCGFVICACVEDCRSNSKAAQVNARVKVRDRVVKVMSLATRYKSQALKVKAVRYRSESGNRAESWWL